MFCKGKHAVTLKYVVFFNPSAVSTQICLKGNSMLLVSHQLKLIECGIPWGNCGIPPCNILLHRRQHSCEKVYHDREGNISLRKCIMTKQGNIPLKVYHDREGSDSFEKVYHYFKARPCDVHNIPFPLEEVRFMSCRWYEPNINKHMSFLP